MATKKTTRKKAQPKKAAKKAPAKKSEPAVAPIPEGPHFTTALSVHQPQELATRDEAIRAFIHSMNKEDHKLIVRADEAPNTYVLRRPTGIMELDIDLGGGFAAGGCSTISGPDNCLAGDTLINHEVRTPNSRRITHKKITLERLYQRFHGIKVPGRGKSQKKTPTKDTSIYTAPSMNDQRGIVQNRILDIVCTGDKECYELKTHRGNIIVATTEHRFFNGVKFVKLGSLHPSNTVYIHNSTRKEAPEFRQSKRAPRKFFYVENHPTAYKKVIVDRKTGNTYFYHVLPKSRACVEAAMSGIALSTYINRLNDGRLDGLEFLTNDQIVHHKNENTTDDHLSNLVVVTRASHMKEHLKDENRDNYFRFIAVEDMVMSIRYVGRRCTYDLRMAAPLNNFVANNFVVHNSGKTYLMFLTMAMQQRLHGHASRIAFAQAEGGFPFDQALNAGLKVSVPDQILEQWQEIRRCRSIPLYTNEELLFFKQEIGQFYIFRGSTGEELTQAILDGVRTNAFDLIGCDSINGLLPQVDASKDMEDINMRASHANLITKFFSKYIPLTTGLNNLNTTTLLFTQQVRSSQEYAQLTARAQKYAKPWAVGGAYAAKHYKLIDLELWNGSKITRGSGKEYQVIGKEFKWLLKKGKAGTHDNKSGEASYYYPHFKPPGGVDLAGELITSGIKRGVIQTRQITKSRKETIVCRPDTGEVIEDFTAPNQKSMRRFIEEDPDYDLGLRREILTQAGVQCLYQ